jgi:addiction module HigA family antidote
MRTIPYPTPAEILVEEFLKPLELTPAQLATEIHISENEIQHIISGKQPITTEIDLRFSRYFDVSEGFWTGLQEDYNRVVVKDKLNDTLRLIKPIQHYSLNANLLNQDIIKF